MQNSRHVYGGFFCVVERSAAYDRIFGMVV